jgi:hypothetical protein
MHIPGTKEVAKERRCNLRSPLDIVGATISTVGARQRTSCLLFLWFLVFQHFPK